jgi:hypothetical protein
MRPFNIFLIFSKAVHAKFSFHFRIHCADAVFAWLKKVVADFLFPPQSQLVGDVITAAEASPIDFEVMAAEQMSSPLQRPLQSTLR